MTHVKIGTRPQEKQGQEQKEEESGIKIDFCVCVYIYVSMYMDVMLYHEVWLDMFFNTLHNSETHQTLI